MIIGLNHIAIAVPELNRAIEQLVHDLGMTMTSTEEVSSQYTSVAFFPIDKTHIELVSPTDEKSPLHKFIVNRGGGLHHLCFETDSLLEDMAKLKAKGYKLLNETPQVGAHQTQVAWIHPTSFHGVLIELVQK